MPGAPPALGHGPGQLIGEVGPVGQPGERIVQLTARLHARVDPLRPVGGSSRHDRCAPAPVTNRRPSTGTPEPSAWHELEAAAGASAPAADGRRRQITGGVGMRPTNGDGASSGGNRVSDDRPSDDLVRGQPNSVFGPRIPLDRPLPVASTSTNASGAERDQLGASVVPLGGCALRGAGRPLRSPWCSRSWPRCESHRSSRTCGSLAARCRRRYDRP